MIMKWKYPKGDDSVGCRQAESVNGFYKYYGEWYDDQPNGLGSISDENGFLKGGYWANGELKESMSEFEYNE